MFKHIHTHLCSDYFSESLYDSLHKMSWIWCIWNRRSFSHFLDWNFKISYDFMFLLHLQFVTAVHDNLSIWEYAGYEVNKNVKRDKNIDFLICTPKKGDRFPLPSNRAKAAYWLTWLADCWHHLWNEESPTDWKIQVSVLKIKYWSLICIFLFYSKLYIEGGLRCSNAAWEDSPDFASFLKHDFLGININMMYQQRCLENDRISHVKQCDFHKERPISHNQMLSRI